MGLARELSMGPPRPRKKSTIAAGPAYEAIRRALAAAERGGDVDVEKLGEAVREVGATTARLRYGEARLYAEGSKFYRDRTGIEIAPVPGIY